MVPHMAWGRRSRIHLRSMSLARLRQPRCPVMATTHASLPGLAPAPASATTSARDLPSSPTTCSTSCLPSPKPLACALAEQDKAGMNRKVLLLSISFDGGCQSLCLPRCWMLVPSQAHHFAIVKDVGQLRPQHRNIHYMASGLSPLPCFSTCRVRCCRSPNILKFKWQVQSSQVEKKKSHSLLK
ncbi:hypothetical protein PVAP13_7NG263324 [Panicum virgatum]|uniref:Uncharacterized protein n=1 Tax=Panicum virgatum TaxID=38727 RepID=A0A8T0Q1D4_PANVG|nr:hypothetical protein PVAP13_7NG263324 [Panicum virgatum]